MVEEVNVMRRKKSKKPKQLDLMKIISSNAKHEDGWSCLVPSRWYLVLLMLVLLSADFLVMYAAIKEIMYEKDIVCIAFSAMISLFFIAAPSLFVTLLAIRDRKRLHMFTAGALIIVLVMMFACLGGWKLGEQIVIVMVGNSLLCMAVTLADVTSSSRTNRKVKKYAAKLQKYIEQEEAVIHELQEALKQDLYKENEKVFNQVVTEVEEREKKIFSKVKLMIAEYLCNPNSVSQLFGKKQEIGCMSDNTFMDNEKDLSVVSE